MQSAALDLAGIADDGPMLLGTPGKSISWESIETNGVPASLGMVRVAAPSFVVNDWGRFRAHFQHGGVYYDLSCTDLSAWQSRAYAAGGLRSQSDWYLTISLGEPWEETNHCYKIVASGLEIPA